MKKLGLILVIACAAAVTAAAKAAGPASISIAPGTTLAFGQLVTFQTTIPKLRGDQTAYVVLSCWQDVNNDGVVDTTLAGDNPDLVYSWIDAPTATFSFSGQNQTSQWTLRGGGSAICRADLDAYSHGGVVILASTGDFPASG